MSYTLRVIFEDKDGSARMQPPALGIWDFHCVPRVGDSLLLDAQFHLFDLLDVPGPSHSAVVKSVQWATIDRAPAIEIIATITDSFKYTAEYPFQPL